MMNMAGGVMENAGLLLDRCGLPIIPGSAIKGCARRAALAALREWCETGTKPAGEDNLFSSLCSEFITPAELLTRLCLVFGWVEQDWSTKKYNNNTWQSDIVWACDGISDTWKAAAAVLCAHFKAKIKDDAKPWESLPNYAGSIAFLHASPNRDPGIILDVVTPHHTKYYQRDLTIATDTEEPVPVFFPAVKEQGEHDYFTFPLIPLNRAEKTQLAFAQCALRTGLETFGIGAKTNAGYGCFDASEDFNRTVVAVMARRANAEAEESARKATAEREAVEAEERRKSKAALEAMTPDERIASLNEAQFENKIRSFWKEPKRGGPAEDEKKAIVNALKGPRLSYWQEFKIKAAKGGDLAKSEQAVRAHNKQLNADKMP
jgi:CRISPR type III-B/RAMP module RAMP protein Cmr6